MSKLRFPSLGAIIQQIHFTIPFHVAVLQPLQVPAVTATLAFAAVAQSYMLLK